MASELATLAAGRQILLKHLLALDAMCSSLLVFQQMQTVLQHAKSY
jgi:hypothetical protein